MGVNAVEAVLSDYLLRFLGVRPSNPFWRASGGLEVATAVFRMRSQTSGSLRRLAKPFWESYCATA